MTEFRDKGAQVPRDDFPGKLERLLKADPLLSPYFEKGVLRIIDEPGADPVWIDSTLEEEVLAFIKGRVMAILLDMGDEALEASVKRSDEREEMINILLADEVLRPYFEDGSISISNRPDTGLMSIRADREIIRIITSRFLQVLREKFGDTPQDNFQA